MSTWCRCWYRGAVELVRSRSLSQVSEPVALRLRLWWLR